MPQAAPQAAQQSVTRVRVFVDFWNYELSMKAVEPGFRTDWRALGPGLVSEAARVINAVGRSDYQGMQAAAQRARTIMDQSDSGRITALLDDFNEAG